MGGVRVTLSPEHALHGENGQPDSDNTATHTDWSVSLTKTVFAHNATQLDVTAAYDTVAYRLNKAPQQTEIVNRSLTAGVILWHRVYGPLMVAGQATVSAFGHAGIHHHDGQTGTSERIQSSASTFRLGAVYSFEQVKAELGWQGQRLTHPSTIDSVPDQVTLGGPYIGIRWEY